MLPTSVADGQYSGGIRTARSRNRPELWFVATLLTHLIREIDVGAPLALRARVVDADNTNVALLVTRAVPLQILNAIALECQFDPATTYSVMTL